MDKMLGLKLYGRRMCVLMLIALNIGCGTAPKPVDSKLQDAKKVWQTIPIYPGMTETTENTISTNSPLVFTKTYKSDANYADVETFYTKELTGWRLLEEGEIKDRGRIRGEQLQGFTKDNYRLLIQFAGERRTELGWDYAIELSPSGYWKNKVD